MAPPIIDTSRARGHHHGGLPPTPSDLMKMTTKNGGGPVAPAAPSPTTTTATSSNYHSSTSHYPSIGLHVPPSPPATDVDDNESETRTTPASGTVATTPTNPGSLSPVLSPVFSSVTSPPYWQQQYPHNSLPFPASSQQHAHPHAQHPSIFSPTSTCSSAFPSTTADGGDDDDDDDNHHEGSGYGGYGSYSAVSRHARTTSVDSLSAIGGFITLRDNESSGADDARNSACWARAVEVTDHVVVNGTAVGHIGAFAVWNIRVETLSVSCISCPSPGNPLAILEPGRRPTASISCLFWRGGRGQWAKKWWPMRGNTRTDLCLAVGEPHEHTETLLGV
jgi:hypothetical protein